MNREIKFRFWSGEKMFCDNKIALDCLTQQVCGIYDHVELHKAAFMQFTGLYDANGKEIYEGDIVRSNPDGVIDRNCKVVFPFYLQVKNKLSGSYSFCSWNLSNKDEIIGNIFENPELLEAAR